MRNSIPTKSLGRASLFGLPAGSIGDTEPCGIEMELVRLDLIDHRLLVSGIGIPFAFKASTSSWDGDWPSSGRKSSTK